MSLVQLVRRDAKLRRRVDTTFPRPKRKIGAVLQAAPPLLSSVKNSVYRPSRVGTAFDYLFRLVLRRKNTNAAVFERSWIVERNIISKNLELDWELSERKRDKIEEILKTGYDWRTTDQGIDCMSYNSVKAFPDDPWLGGKHNQKLKGATSSHCFLIKDQWLANCLQIGLSVDQMVDDLINSLKEHRNRVQEYREVIAGARYFGEQFVRTGELPSMLLSMLLKMSNLDLLFRVKSSSFLPPEPDPIFTETISQHEIDDLLAMYQAIPQNTFEGEKVFLNPDLSIQNWEFRPNPVKPFDGGVRADADVIIDDLLIDVKTTKDKITPTVPLQDFCQLMGYYALTQLSTKHDIKRLGIYYARYGYFYEIPVPRALPDKGGRAGFVEWFRKHVRISLDRVPEYRSPNS